MMAVLFFVFLFLIRSILLPFVLGILTAYFLDPAADRLEKMRLSRTMATTCITIVFFVIIGLATILIFPIIIEQLSGLLTALPNYIITLQTRYTQDIAPFLKDLPVVTMDSFKEGLSSISSIMLDITGGFANSLLQSGMAIVNLVSLIVLTPVVTFYLLRDWDRIVARFDALLPRNHADTIRTQLRIIDQTLSGFVHGQITACTIMGIYYAVALSAVGLKFGGLIGLATGFLAILPYVGVTVGMSSGLIAALVQFDDHQQIAIVLCVFIVGQMAEGYVVTPKLVGSRVGLHPLWVIFGMLAGAALFGFVGILIAIPTTAVVGVLIRFATANYLQSAYYLGESPSPKR